MRNDQTVKSAYVNMSSSMNDVGEIWFFYFKIDFTVSRAEFEYKNVENKELGDL